MPGDTCDVCGDLAIGVGCSALGPISVAYCNECSEHGCEPYGMTVGAVAMMPASNLEALSPWFHPVLFATCLRAGKTAAEFWADVAAEMMREAAG